MTIPTAPAGEPLDDAYRLPTAHLTLAVADCVMARKTVAETCAALPREDPSVIAERYWQITDARSIGGGLFKGAGASQRGRASPKRCPLPSRNRIGMTLEEIAAKTSIPRATLAALMERHGLLECVFYGGRQRRRLATDHAYHAGLGHNVDGSRTRIAAVEGHAKACVFPVFYSDRLDDIIHALDFGSVVNSARALPTKQQRLTWLLAHHDYLPNDELARLSGMSLRSVDAAAAKARQHTDDRKAA